MTKVKVYYNAFYNNKIPLGSAVKSAISRGTLVELVVGIGPTAC
jgi:hypothetical protein